MKSMLGKTNSSAAHAQDATHAIRVHICDAAHKTIIGVTQCYRGACLLSRVSYMWRFLGLDNSIIRTLVQQKRHEEDNVFASKYIYVQVAAMDVAIDMHINASIEQRLVIHD